jgi:hypothetical protein
MISLQRHLYHLWGLIFICLIQIFKLEPILRTEHEPSTCILVKMIVGHRDAVDEASRRVVYRLRSFRYLEYFIPYYVFYLSNDFGTIIP